MTSFWGELKRRNVVRVSVAYVIVAWLLLQVADVVLNNIEAPDWVFQAILLLVALGFPFALIFAWAFELTPEGLKKEKDVDRSESITHITGRKLDFIIIGVLLVALVMFAVERFVLLPERAPATDALQEIVATEVQQSIAVLPFVNMSSDPEQEYFSDGLSEEILNLLAKIPELKVIGRTSSFAFKGKNEDLRIIGQALGVNTLLEGSVRKSGDRVRITAQLIDVSDGAHIWSETYDRTLNDIFAVQDDVAAAIIDALQIHVGANPTRGRPTENTEAYVRFLKARASLNDDKKRNAEELLLEAVELDPNFAEAYELLADTYWSQAGSEIEAAAAQELMGEAASKALALDPNLVYARVMYQLGNPKTYSHFGEIKALEWAMREAPNNTDAVGQLFFDFIVAGYLQEALGIAERYVELEPLSSSANDRLSAALWALGRTSEAIAALEVVDLLSPGGANWTFGVIDLLEKRDDSAVAHFEAALEQIGLPSDWVSDLVAGARNPATGQAYLDRRLPQIAASMLGNDAAEWRRRQPYWYLNFGFLDRYFELILASELTDSTWTDAQNFIFVGNIYRDLGFTAHPKYLEVAEATGIVDVWEQRGPPDFCTKESGHWVCE